MSVLKSTQHGSRVVAPFRFASPVVTAGKAEEGSAPGPSPLQAPVAAQSGGKSANSETLEQARRIAELEQALRDEKAKAEKDCAAAQELGRLEGRKEAEKLDKERLAALEEALKTARSDALKALDAQRNLAVDIARATLTQILGDESAFASMVVETAAYWKAKLAGAAILKVRVSAEDFADGYALERLKVAVGNLDVEPSSELKPGACVFVLQLGEVDASIPVQASKADDLLAEYAIGAPAE